MFQPNTYVDAYGTLLHGRLVPSPDRYTSNLIMCSSPADNLNFLNLKDDSQIIQEIVQKFILIPKSQTVTEVHVEEQKQHQAQPKSAADDINWKSKYDILNQLKENEIEEPTKLIRATNDIPTKDTKEQRKTDINESNNYPATRLTPTDVYPLNIQKLSGTEDSIPMQSIYNNKICDDNRLEDHGDFIIQGLSENIKYDIDDQLKTASTIENIESNLDPKSVHRDPNTKKITEGHAGDNSNEFLNIQDNNHIKYSEYDNNVYHSTQESFVKDNANTEYLQDDRFNSIEENPPTEAIYEFNNPLQQYTENNEQLEDLQYPISNKHPEVFTPNDAVVLNDGVNINPKGYAGNEQSEPTQCPIEVTNSEQFISNNDGVLKDGGNINYEGYEEREQSERMQYPINDLNTEEFTSNDGVVLGDGVNTNPEGYEGVSNYGIVTLSHQSDNIGDIVEPVLSQAEVEQNVVDAQGIEEFESEQRDMWHESPGENVEYSQEAYEQPNQYYYEQGQEYPVNEHEETQLNYDQSYQQQYVNQYEAEYNQQEAQQYDQSQAYHEGYEQNYETQPVYDGYNEEDSNQHQQQIHGSPQTIEQDLDQEQGFVEKNIEEKKASNTNATESPPYTGVDATELK